MAIFRALDVYVSASAAGSMFTYAMPNRVLKKAGLDAVSGT
jgi:hypothetical protein